MAKSKKKKLDPITIREAAERLNLHKNTVGSMIADGRLIATTIQGRYLIDPAELDEIVIIRDSSSKPIIYRRDAA